MSLNNVAETDSATEDDTDSATEDETEDDKEVWKRGLYICGFMDSNIKEAKNRLNYPCTHT